jgi:hypothetical protein
MATSHRVPPEEKPAPLNGHAAKRVNGHSNGKLPGGPLSHADESACGEVAAENNKRDRARADSDDTHGVSNGASVIAAPPAANTDHDRSAEAARDSSNRKKEGDTAASSRKRTPRRKKTDKAEETREPVPPGLDVLPADGPAFTEALNAQADLLEVGRRLLNSSDERIIKGVWEHMLELRYGKEAPTDENARRIVIDMPCPLRTDLPTQ